MDAQSSAFLEAVKRHGTVARAQEAALTSAQAPTTGASSSRAAEPAIPPVGAASSSCDSVHAVPAKPKRNAKRKLLDVVPASSAQQAPAVDMPVIASLPDADLEHLYHLAKKQKTSNSVHVSILEQVHELGHYPERIVKDYANATSTQKLEDAL